MKILILGAGQVGRTAAHNLAREPANEVTVVDSNDAVLRIVQRAPEKAVQISAEEVMTGKAPEER